LKSIEPEFQDVSQEYSNSMSRSGSALENLEQQLLDVENQISDDRNQLEILYQKRDRLRSAIRSVEEIRKHHQMVMRENIPQYGSMAIMETKIRHLVNDTKL
jgi:DNA repair exonuclease SbcCD ATPase subunit